MSNEAPKSEDPYGGFNEYDHAYDLENVYNDAEFMRAAQRTSHSRRPTTANRQPIDLRRQQTGQNGANRIPTASAMRSSLASRRNGDVVRPMTAVRAAGFTSGGRRSTFDGVKPPTANSETVEEAQVKRIRQLEVQVKDLLIQCAMAHDEKQFKEELDKAKEAGRKEQQMNKLRRDASLPDNPDLFFLAQFASACAHMSNNLLNEALGIYEIIMKEEQFKNAQRLKVNIGNIYFRKRDFAQAVKFYRMALDRVEKVHERIRTRILGNIGVALVKLGRYEDAMAAFEECLETSGGDYGAALNLILAAYCLEDTDKMREAFQRLVDIPTMISTSDDTESDILVVLTNSDLLRQWEGRRKQQAEHTIMAAAKIISRQIAGTFAEGYAWCVTSIKQSVYATLATELEMNKAVDMLKQGQLDNATETLNAFINKDSKVSTAAANNLAVLELMKGRDRLSQAAQYAEQAFLLDRYNSNALVNRGNVSYLTGNEKEALHFYKEALQVEPSCIQAIYNIGLVSRKIDDWESAKNSFYKLNNMLINNVQVLTQLALLYEENKEYEQARDFYNQASTLAPTDPAIQSKLANLYDIEGNKSDAFVWNVESYRSYPSNIEVIKWLGNYFVDAQLSEKAVHYFEKAAIMEPHNIEWQMLMAGCQRRSGNFQKALEHYRQIHRRFPHNIECLKFLVQLCSDLRMPEKSEYEEKLKKLERMNLLRLQRESDSSQNRRAALHSGSIPSTSRSLSSNTRQESRTTSANQNRALLDTDEPYRISKRDLSSADFSYNDMLAPEPQRPKTGINETADPFDMRDFVADDLLPE
ncbi:hypothetical protein M3Y95_00711300 [Aphelenchoides besseyi]|nr:hypothetical protein M3Y95_00711300 [Aphelenchoides besseyi]